MTTEQITDPAGLPSDLDSPMHAVSIRDEGMILVDSHWSNGNEIGYRSGNVVRHVPTDRVQYRETIHPQSEVRDDDG